MQNPKLELKKIDMKEGEGLTIRHDGSDIRSIFITAGHSDLTVTGMQNRNSKTYRYHVLGVDEIDIKIETVNIDQRILNGICRFKMNNAKAPKFLYLGRDEKHDLYHWVYSNNYRVGVSMIENGDVFLGLTIYYVNINKHFAII